MYHIQMLRRVSRIGTTSVLFLPPRYAGKHVRVLMTKGDGTSTEFDAVARRFARAAYVAIPSVVADDYPPGTVVVMYLMEVE